MKPIRVARRYSAPPDRVFGAWLDRETAGSWLFATALHPMAHVAIDARVAGSFCFVDGQDTEYSGEYLQIIRPRRLAFTLLVGGEPGIVTRVAIEIVALKRGSELRLVHEDVPADRAARTEARWTGILYGLGVALDNPVRRQRKGPIRAMRGARGMRAGLSISRSAERPLVQEPTQSTEWR